MTDPNPNPNPAPDPNPAPNDPPKNDPKPWTPPASQEEFDRIIGDRLARERSRFSDYDELKKKAQAHDKALEDAKSEQDKAVDAARKEGESAAAQKANARLVSAEVRAQAATARFRDPTDAIAQLKAAGKLDGIKVDDNGDADADAIKVLLDDLAKAKPYLVGDEPPKPPPSFGGGPRKTDNQPEATPGVGRLRNAYANSSNNK